MLKTYDYIITPGHGYLKVPMETIRAINFIATEFSYYNKDWAYLEEDCDMPAFMDVAVNFTLNHVHWDRDIPKYNLHRFTNQIEKTTYFKVKDAWLTR